MSYKLKHTNSTFPFKVSPLQQTDYVGTSTGVKGTYVAPGAEPPVKPKKLSRSARFKKWRPKVFGKQIKKRYPFIALALGAYDALSGYYTKKEQDAIKRRESNKKLDEVEGTKNKPYTFPKNDQPIY